jgi:hypothetical protein
MVYDLRGLDILFVVPEISCGSHRGQALFDFVPQEPLRIWRDTESLVGLALSTGKMTHAARKNWVVMFNGLVR